MKRLTGLLLSVAAAGLIGCGDSSVECGEGTDLDDDGFCVPTGEPVTCTDGTMLDETTNTCVIDPDSCQSGTVLIGGACVDPTDGLTVDVTEGAEPNGFDVGGELSDDPAGEFLVKPIGQKVVLQGNFTPRADRDDDGVLESDFDTYLFQVDNPTLLEISVDGVGGAVGGFVTLSGDVEALAQWIRFGISQSGDTAMRQVWLPSPGIYILAVSDSRGLLGDYPAGDADNKYFVSIEAKTIPTATALTFTDNDVVKLDTISSDEIDFYTAPLGEGFNTVDLRTFDPDMEGSLVISTGPRVRAASDEVRSTSGDSQASAFFGGVKTGETPIIAVDHVINTASAAVDYRLHVHTNAATALSSNGGTAMADNITDFPDFFEFDQLAQFYFDVNNTDQITGFDISWNVGVDTIVLDENGGVVSVTTYLNALFGAPSTWDSYKGFIRTAAPGRYYILAYDPFGAVGDDLIATSKYGAVATGTLTYNTLLDNATPNVDYNTNAYKYVPGDEDWQMIDHSADTASGGTVLRYFDPSDAYGFLDDLSIDGGTDSILSDPIPWIETGADAGDSIQQGLITIGLPEEFLVTVHTIDDAGTYDLNNTMRTYQDEGTHSGVVGTPYTVTHNGETLDANFEKYYLLRTTPGQEVSISVEPGATVDAAIVQLGYDESGIDGVNDAGLGGDETLTVTADGSGYVAFVVFSLDGDGTTYNLTLTATAPPPPYYTVAQGTTAYVNVCAAAGSTDVTPVNNDDALTNNLLLPTGFQFFGSGVDAQAIKASTNGWFSFETSVTSSDASNSALPDATIVNTVVAPYWDDLINVRMCTQTVGTKFYIQWRGQVYQGAASSIMAFQAILDASDDSIEFVYANYHRGTGETATGGLQNEDGTDGTTLFFDESDPLDLAGVSLKFTHQ